MAAAMKLVKRGLQVFPQQWSDSMAHGSCLFLRPVVANDATPTDNSEAVLFGSVATYRAFDAFARRNPPCILRKRRVLAEEVGEHPRDREGNPSVCGCY